MNQQKEQDAGNVQDRKINLRALEGAGFVHLYGLAPIINFLKANKRDLKNVESIVDLDLLEGEDLEHKLKQRDQKLEAQFTTWLFVKENMKYGSSGGKTGDKAAAAQEVEQIANQMNATFIFMKPFYQHIISSSSSSLSTPTLTINNLQDSRRMWPNYTPP